MQTDFSIKNGIYLVKDDLVLDLHNNFDFKEVRYSVAERRVSLLWQRSMREGIEPDIPASVRIDFFEVSEFRFNPRNAEMPFTEDDCLKVAGYWTDDDWCDGVFFSAAEENPDSNYLTAFDFMSGAVIILQAMRATALIEFDIKRAD